MVEFGPHACELLERKGIFYGMKVSMERLKMLELSNS